jgi:threonine dehydratase
MVETVRLLAVRHHVIAEAAGAAFQAVALAGMAGKGNIACIISGGNIDPPKLGDILNGRNPF